MLVGKAILLHALNKTHSCNSQKQNNVISLIIILRQKANISSPLDSCTKLGQSLLKCSTEPQILHPPPAHRIGKQIKSVRMKFKILTNFEGIKFQSNSLIFSPNIEPTCTTASSNNLVEPHLFIFDFITNNWSWCWEKRSSRTC